MLIKIPKRKTLSFTRSIEENAHLAIRVRKIPITHYYPLSRAAELTATDPKVLMYKAINSRTLHIFTDGERTIVHPDGLQKLIKQYFIRFFRGVAKSISELGSSRQKKMRLLRRLGER